ncbi:MAG: biotin transporter BioY [Candidatus Methanosuratus sp.]|nr:biotin transporter BioY [Candidatus Methanosuratincola sp.]
MSRARELSLAAVFAAMMAAGAMISIPFFLVPLSLQTLFLYLSVLLLGRGAFLGQAIYLAMGIAGLPVFSKGMAGYATIIGPTGGFLVGFLVSAIASGWLLSSLRGKRHADVLAIALCMAIVFTMGWIWLSYWMAWNFYAALLAGVLPFLPGDLLKAGIALGIAKKVRL